MAEPVNGNQRQKEGAIASPEVPPPAGGDLKPEEIARLAYQYWQQRVHPIGTPEEEDWSRAEVEIKQRENKPPMSAEPEPNPQHPGAQAGAPGSESATEEAPTKEAPVKEEAAANEAPAKEAPVEEGPAKGAKAKEPPTKEAAGKEAPVKKAPTKEAAGKDAPVKKAPTKEAAAKSWIASDKGSRSIKIAFGILVLLNVAVAAYFLWQHFRPKPLGEGFASGNGRIEAVDVDVAAKSPGRISEMFVDDGDLVKAGQVVAKMDTKALQAELQQAVAQEAEARNAMATAFANVSQRESEHAASLAVVTEREAEQVVAERTVERSRVLSAEHATSVQEFDNDIASQKRAAAAVLSAKAQAAASQATISATRSQVLEASSRIEAAIATESRIRVEIAEGVLRAPRDGRVQFRIAQPGEVVSAGGKVLSMIDLTDVTMTFFVTEAAAGRVAIGAEVHLVLDAAPKDVIPATVSFVSSANQFTPKTVETQSEREKLVFRVKARIDPALLRKYTTQVKSGLPGVAYVRLDSAVPWPDKLRTRIP